MSVSSYVVVLLDGSKTFWKTRTYLKIIIVQHVHTKCLEVISFDPAIGVEYPRIYLDTALIASELDPDIIEETYAQKKEALNRQKISKKKEDLVDEIKLNMVKQYAYARVNLVTDLPDGRTEVNLLPSFDDILVEGDKGDNKIDVERLKPADLVPYEHKIVIVKSKVEEFKAMHEEMNKEVSLANQELNNATRLASAALHAFFAAFRKHVRRLSISSNPRKRWILVINRILVSNYVRAVRIRLSRSAQYKDFSGLPEDFFLNISPATAPKSSNTNTATTKTLGGRKISGGLKGSFDDSLIIENFNRVFNDKNNLEKQQQFAQNNITPFNNSSSITNSNTNSYDNLRMQFNKSKTTGNLNYQTVSAQDTRDDVAASQTIANGFISKNIDFTNNINSRQYNISDGDSSNATTVTGSEGISQKLLGPRRTSGGMLGSFDDSDLYFSRHHNINFNADTFNADNTTTTAATGEEQEEETLPPITGVQSMNSLQTAIGLKMFRSDFQKAQTVETRRVYGDNIKGATDTGLVINSTINSNSNNSNNSFENSCNIRNKGIKSPTRSRPHTAGFPDISGFALAMAIAIAIVILITM